MMTNRNRRSFITTVGAIGTVGLAGCFSDLRERRDGDGSAAAETSSDPDPEGNDGGSGERNRPDLPGEVVDDFETFDRWMTMVGAGTLEPDEEDPYAGSQSARLRAEDGTEYAGIYKSTPRGLDLSGKALSLAVRYTGREQLKLSLVLVAPNADHELTLRRTLTGPTDRWVRVDFGATAIDGEPDLAEIREIYLIARRRGDHAGPIDCSVDDLRAIDRPERGSVTLLFDGTLESHYTTAFEHMERFGFPGVEAVIPEAVGNDGRLSADALSELDDAGWDMAARPRTGARHLHDYPVERQEGMIKRTKAYLENRGFEAGARHFVTPRNVLGTETLDLVRKHHEQAFRYGGGPNGVPTTDPHNLGFFSGRDVTDATHFVDLAERYGQHAVLHFEHVGDDGLDEDTFEGLLKYIDKRDVDVLSASELLDR